MLAVLLETLGSWGSILTEAANNTALHCKREDRFQGRQLRNTGRASAGSPRMIQRGSAPLGIMWTVRSQVVRANARSRRVGKAACRTCSAVSGAAGSFEVII